MIIEHNFDSGAPQHGADADKQENYPVGRVLAVGFQEQAVAMLAAGHFGERHHYCICDFEELTTQTLKANTVSIVCTPLLARGFDAFEMAEELVRLRFTGLYTVLVSALPDCAIVAREFKQAFPTLKIQIVELQSL